MFRTITKSLLTITGLLLTYYSTSRLLEVIYQYGYRDGYTRGVKKTLDLLNKELMTGKFDGALMDGRTFTSTEWN